MIWDRQLHALIPNNPIVVRDLRHQQRTTSFWRGLIESVGAVAVALGFAAAMVFCVAYTSDLRYQRDYLFPIQILAWIFHAAAALRLLVSGVFVVLPDKFLVGSDDLKLTPLSNWQLLFGKWWAALHQTRGWILALGIVQLALGSAIVFGLQMHVNWTESCRGRSCEVIVQGLLYPQDWDTPFPLLSMATSAIGITFLEVMCCSALGLAVAVTVRSKVALIYAIVLRFAPASIILLYLNGYGESMITSWWYSLEYTLFSFVDGATGTPLVLASDYSTGMLGLHTAIGAFLIYIVISLVVALAVMERSRR